MRSLCIIGFLAVATACDDHGDVPAPQPSVTRTIVWPDLTSIAAVSGRPATQDDVAAGRAVFVLQNEGNPVGSPIDIELPQYAYHVDQESGDRTPGILIQAEEAAGQQIVGFVVLPDRSHMAATLPEFELLGSKAPE